MTIRAVVFDLFGTLVPKWPSALAREMRRELCDILQLDYEAFIKAWRQTDFAREIGQVTFEHGILLAAEACTSVDRQRVDQAMTTWLKFVGTHVTPREHVLTTLKACRERGWRIGLLSDCNDDVPRVFRRLAIAPLFDTLGFSCELGVMKPDGKAYAEVCRGLGVQPQHCAYLGDGGSNELRGARKAGMTVVFFRHANEIEQEGLPAGARGWPGPTIERLTDLWQVLGYQQAADP